MRNSKKSEMDKFVKNLGVITICLLFIQLASCRKEAFNEKVLGHTALSFDQPNGLYTVGGNSAFVKDVDKVSIPVEISLSEAAAETFTVSLVSNTNAAKTAISSQTLTNTIALESTAYTLPQQSEVRFGVKKVTFNVVIAMNNIEVNYGKKIAIGIDLANPTKGNTINQNKKTVVVLINTADIVAAQDVHYLSFNKSGILNLTTLNSTKDAFTLTIPLQIDLSGTVGKAFSMKLVSDPAAVAALIANGSLTNTRVLNDGAVFFTTSPTIGLNLSSTPVQLSVNIADLLVNYGTKWAFALTITEPEHYQVLESKKTVIVVIDPAKVVDDITALLKNTSQPFVAQTIEPVAKRWGKLANWTSNDAANTFKGAAGFGSYDANNATNISFEAFSPDRPNITNGKIFQSIPLPVGNYRFQVTLRSGSTSGTVYAAAALGTTIPDVTLVPTSTLGFVKFTATTGAYNVNFRVNSNNSTVSLGMAATITQNTSFNINNVKLFRVLE